MNIKLSILAGTACGLLLAIPSTAATGSVAKASRSTAKATSAPHAWPAETLSGKIAMVDPARRLVIVKTPDGVPYDMTVTAKTGIKLGNRSIALKDLAGDVNKQASIQFVPESRGDVAKDIRISG